MRKRNDNPPQHKLGVPPRPKGLTRAGYAAWNKLTGELLAARNLYEDEGGLIAEWLQARSDQYKGTGKRREAGRKRAAEFQAKFDARPPAPAPVAEPIPEKGLEPAPTVSLESFLAAVRYERVSFPARMIPGATVCRDLAGVYEWPPEDPATVARDYCQQVTQGGVVACELLRRACTRHLNDLETGHERGLFFDPVAARNIAAWYRDFCGLRLEPWEVWIVVSLFAWKKASGLRRFTEAWISMAKKNGKTTLCSGAGLFGLIADQEKYADVFSAATKKEQARLVYRDAVRAVHDNPELRAWVREFKTGKLVVEDSDSTFAPLSSDTNSMDGLRPSLIICDEVACWESREQFDKLTKGVVSRSQPLIISITTAGESENTFAHTKHVLAKKILEGVFIDDTTFIAIYELDKDDDFKDEACWPKASPNLGVSIQASALRKILAEAVEDTSGESAFRRYHCNSWVSFKAGRSIPAAKWDKCRGMEAFPDLSAMDLRKKFLEENHQTKCWMGLDYGAIQDTTCVTLFFPKPKIQGIIFDNPTIVNYVWMPEAGIQEKERKWGVPLQSWARAGWIFLQEGDMCDPLVIKNAMRDLILNGPGKCMGVGYDPWQSRVAMELLAAEVPQCEIKEVAQKWSNLTIPCKELKKHIWDGTLWHLNNPVSRWFFGNVLLEEAAGSGGMTPRKLSNDEKIDGVSSAVTAWARYLESPKVPDNPYNTRGILFI